MSDEEVTTKKGRKAAVEATKRSKKDAKAEVEDAPPVKRGRGRPPKGAGATKKVEKKETKAKSNGVGRRGRKKKEEKEESADEEENGDKSSAGEEEEDDD